MPQSIEYTEHPLMPGKKLFRCEQLSATLAVPSCAGMWQEANSGSPASQERLWRCRGCVVGAQHAGAGDVAVNPLRGIGMCCRCSRTDLRLIHGLACVSCYNRALEAKKGRNAKGAKPKMHPGIATIRLRYVVEGQALELKRDAVSVTELAVQLLRDSPKRVVFGLGRGDAAVGNI